MPSQWGKQGSADESFLVLIVMNVSVKVASLMPRITQQAQAGTLPRWRQMFQNDSFAKSQSP